MCAPLVCSYMGDRAKLTSSGIWLYNLGRIASYTLAGLVLGGTGEFILNAIPSLGRLITICLGSLLIGAALYKASQLLGLWRSKGNGLKVKLTWVTSFLSRWPRGLRELGFGFVTVLLPCMTLTPVLAMAATSQNHIKGALLMLSFGLGTTPIMLGATYVPLIIYRKLPPFLLSWLVVLFLLAAGIVTITR